MYRIFSIIVAVIMTMPAMRAQEVLRLGGGRQGDLVQIENRQVTAQEDKTVLSMDFVLDSLRVPSNRYRAFTPIVRSADGQHSRRLRSLLVSGRTQNIVFQRTGIDPLYRDNCVNVVRQRGRAQRYSYLESIPAEPWHRGAQLLVECDLCGCGDTLSSRQLALGDFLPPLPVVVEKPNPLDLIALTDAVPAPVKPTLHLHGSAFITFVVNRWEVKPDYMDNQRELRKITDTLDVMVKDPNISVRSIKIHGWASPESPYKHNEMLAQNRAQSLTDHVRRLYNLPANVFEKAQATPENWIGLRQALDTISTTLLPHRSEFITVADKVLSDLGSGITNRVDRDELSLRNRYAQEYQYVLKNVYPHLRRTDYDISFDIRQFTLAEAKEIYKTRPQHLSLRELYDVAQTFPQGSDERNRALQQALLQNPDSTVAMLNVANIALREGDVLRAETLLQRAGDSAQAWQARGVAHILRGRYDEAAAALDKAEALGADVSRNREAIEKLK